MSKVEQQLMFLVGMITVMLGAYVTIGWLMANPAMVKIVSSSTAMVLNTAFCFILSGTWLLLKPTFVENGTARTSHFLMGTITLTLIILPLIVLIEIIADTDFNIDWTTLHQVVLDRNPHPGRMAPNACLGFIFIGLAYLSDWIGNSHLRKAAFLLLGPATLFLGASSLMSNVMQLDWLYNFIQYNRMALPTSVGLSLIGLILVLAGKSTTYEIPTGNKGEDVRLTRIAAVIMILLALASGLTGFLVLKRGVDQSLQESLKQKTVTSADTIATTLEQQFLLTDKLLSFPMLTKDLETLPLDSQDPASLEHLNKVGTILLNLGFEGLQIRNNDNVPIFTLGMPVTHSDLSMPIKLLGHDASLLWDEGLVLRSAKPILKNDIIIGTVITDQHLKSLDRLFAQIRQAGKTTDTGLCIRDEDYFNCFPTRFVSHAVHVRMFDNGLPAFPVAHALLGETGIIYANDIRGVPVLAAYTPIGNTGLAIGIKVETTEIYGFIRQRLDTLLAILIVFVVMGFYIMRSRIQPLASRLVRSELRMRMSNEILEQDAHRLNQIIAIQNEIARSPLDIAHSLQIMVEQVQTLTSSDGAVVEMIEGDELFYRAASGTFATSQGFRLKIAGSLSGHCMKFGKIVRCDDTETDPRTDKTATRKLNIRSMIVVPLLNEGVAIGVLKTAAARPNAFTLKDEQSLQLLSGLIGAAISHQIDYEEKQRLLGERTTALQVLEQTTDHLRISEERTRIIIESAYDAFIAMDSAGSITDWNKQAQYIFGWDREEVIGKSLADLMLAPASRQIYMDQITKVLAHSYAPEPDQRLEINVVRRNGESMVVEMTLSPVRTGNTVMLTSFLHDITERKKTQQKLTQLAQYDALTGLPNRSLFMDRLSMTIWRSARNDKAIALMFLDLDGFKKINDNFGHQAGDALLKQVAERLSGAVRKSDTVSRLAGDEFTIILEDLADPEHNIQTLAAKIIQSIAQPFDIVGEQVTVTTSIGIAISKSGKKNIDDVIHSADAEMYKAKNSGKNQFSLRWI